MYASMIAIAVTATILGGGAAPVAAATRGAFDDMRMTYRATTGDYCITAGWGLATRHTRRLVREGDCRTADEWRKRGLELAAAPVKTRTPRLV